MIRKFPLFSWWWWWHQNLWHFQHGWPVQWAVQYGRESAHKSIGWLEATTHLTSAEPNSKGFLLSLSAFCQCQDFVDAEILSTPRFCRRPYFVNTNILSTPIFVNANILSTPIIFSRPIILSTRVFCQRQYFVATNILSAPVFLILFRLRMIIFSNDCVLYIS